MWKCIVYGNGFIWHTAGGGNTPSSFSASIQMKANGSIHKCVFVVDNKDRDRQKWEKFNCFKEKCVEENSNTAALVCRVLFEDYADKDIVTTLQKFGLAINDLSE